MKKKVRNFEWLSSPIKSGIVRVLLDGLGVDCGGFEIVPCFEKLIALVFQRCFRWAGCTWSRLSFRHLWSFQFFNQTEWMGVRVYEAEIQVALEISRKGKKSIQQEFARSSQFLLDWASLQCVSDSYFLCCSSAVHESWPLVSSTLFAS